MKSYIVSAESDKIRENWLQAVKELQDQAGPHDVVCSTRDSFRTWKRENFTLLSSQVSPRRDSSSHVMFGVGNSSLTQKTLNYYTSDELDIYIC